MNVMDPLFPALPEDLAAASDDELNSFISGASEVAREVAQSPEKFAEGRDLMAEMTAGVAAIETARAELKRREEAAAETGDEDEATEATFDADGIAQLAARVNAENDDADEDEDEGEDADDSVAASAEHVQAPGIDIGSIVAQAVAATAAAFAPKPVEAAPEAEETVEEETVTASADKRLPRPARSRAAEPQPEPDQRVPFTVLTAAGQRSGYALGDPIDESGIASVMSDMHRTFFPIPEGTHGEKVGVAKLDWSGEYPTDRFLNKDYEKNWEKVEAVTASAKAQREIVDNFVQRRNADATSLTASGGLCAPVTPYYNLQMISVADRPVRAALPAFNADRGGIKNASPAALSAVTTAVGTKTMAQDAAGGTTATKTCQVIPCPSFTETDIEVIYHCVEFGNVGARTFPELLAQWNALVLAAHARTAETLLLDGIKSKSTAVTASNAMGLGASAHLLSQVLTAAAGMRSRHRMRSDAVLRVLLPYWVQDLLVSDVYRSQFERFDMDAARFVALLRAGNVEPTFYIDGPTSGGQVYGTQSAGALLTFPSTVDWFIYPEGSFLYLDGGILELGLVRDSTLNATNDFQIFGESFENVAFVGVESLAITSTLDDRGTVSLPHAVTSSSYA